MNEESALLAAVLADPADDAPRLVLADWYDEHEQGERAEFIRTSIRSHRAFCRLDKKKTGKIGCNNTLCPKCGLAYDARVRHLWKGGADILHNGRQWMPPDFPGEWEWDDRGFVESLTLSAADCLARLDTIIQRHPIRRVELTTMPDDCKPFGALLSVSDDGSLEYRSERWPRIEFKLPEFGPSRLRGAYLPYRTGQLLRSIPPRPLLAPAWQSVAADYAASLRGQIARGLGLPEHLAGEPSETP